MVYPVISNHDLFPEMCVSFQLKQSNPQSHFYSLLPLIKIFGGDENVIKWYTENFNLQRTIYF